MHKSPAWGDGFIIAARPFFVKRSPRQKAGETSNITSSGDNQKVVMSASNNMAKRQTTSDLKPIPMDVNELLGRYAQGERAFTKADLGEAHLSGTNLSRVILRDGDLSEANLSAAYLKGADLRGADLKGADLRGTYLRGADLRGTDLRWAHMQGTDISQALYNIQTRFPAELDPKALGGYAIAPGADLENAYLCGADLRWTKLTDCNLKRAYLHRSDLRSADLRGADLTDADLSAALYDDLTQFHAEFDLEAAGAYAIAPNASLINAKLWRARLSGVDLSGADLTDANLYRADLSRANLQGANLTDANLWGANLIGANLQGANLQDTILEEADMRGAIAPDGTSESD